MKEKTKRQLLVLGLVVFIAYYALFVGVVYRLYVQAKIAGADAAFADAYREWLVSGEDLRESWGKFNMLDEDRNNVLRVRINEAEAALNRAEVLRLLDLERASLNQMRDQLQTVESELFRDDTIRTLAAQAQKLAIKERREIALSIASLARSENGLKRKWVALMKDDTNYHVGINQYHVALAKGQINTDQYDEMLLQLEGNIAATRALAYQTGLESDQKREQIYDLWARF